MPARRPSTPARARAPRLVAMLTAALVLAAGIAVGSSPAEADAAAPSSMRLDLSASSSRVAPGHSVLLRGTLGRTTASHAARVDLQQRLHGTRRWRTVGRLAVGTGGRVRMRTDPLHGTRDFRLRLRTATRTLTSRVSTVVVPNVVVVTATSPLTPTAGEAVVLAGTTTDVYRGSRIFLQRLGATGWRTIASSLVAKDSTFNVESVATIGGDQSYRAVLRPTAGRPGAVTDPVVFTVYAWYRVTDLASAAPTHAADHPLARAVVTIGGTVFEQSLSAAQQTGESAIGAFALGGLCTRVRGTVGPGADATGQARWRLFADDDLVADQTMAAGSSAAVAGTITGAEVLELRTFQLSGSGTAAWGAPEVLCAGRP